MRRREGLLCWRGTDECKSVEGIDRLRGCERWEEGYYCGMSLNEVEREEVIEGTGRVAVSAETWTSIDWTGPYG